MEKRRGRVGGCRVWPSNSSRNFPRNPLRFIRPCHRHSHVTTPSRVPENTLCISPFNVCSIRAFFRPFLFQEQSVHFLYIHSVIDIFLAVSCRRLRFFVDGSLTLPGELVEPGIRVGVRSRFSKRETFL